MAIVVLSNVQLFILFHIPVLLWLNLYSNSDISYEILRIYRVNDHWFKQIIALYNQIFFFYRLEPDLIL